MNDQKGLQNELLVEIGKRVKELGFRQNLSRQAFYKKMPFGKYSFHISFIHHKDDIDVTADVAIRFDALEDLIHQQIPIQFPTKNETHNTFSFGAELGNLKGTGQKRWTIFNKSDIEKIAKGIVSEFIKIGLPYLEKYSDINLDYKAISEVSREASSLNAVPNKQAINAIGLAYLLKQENEFYKIADEMERYLASIPNSGLDIFLEFKEKLIQLGIKK